MSQGEERDQSAHQLARSRLAHVDQIAETERLKKFHEGELLDFVRDTVAQLEALADRLEVYVTQREEGTGDADRPSSS